MTPIGCLWRYALWRDWQVQVMATNVNQVQFACSVPLGIAGAALRVRWATLERLRGPITGSQGPESARLLIVSQGGMPEH